MSVTVVDLRSDTISRPTQAMRQAMFEAVVGDDVYGEDPTVLELERRSAVMLGKEAAVFVPSGTMANLLAIMVHCSQRGSELIAGDMGHTFLFEQGGTAQLAGVQTALVRTLDDGTFDLEEVESKIRKTPDIHEPTTSLIIIENTHNMAGGQVLPMSFLKNISILAKKYGVALHMDGARIFNASVKLGIPAKEIAKDFDSVCFCLSKNLGCPAGSILLGSADFIKRAHRLRKALGGGMRQTGILAAAGLVALDQMINRLADDHRRTLEIARAIKELNSPMFKVKLDQVHTNICMIYLDEKNGFVAKDVIKRLAEVRESDSIKVSLKCGTRFPTKVRFVVYHSINDEDVKNAIARFREIFKEFESTYGTKKQ